MASKYGIVGVVKDLLTGNLQYVPEEVEMERLKICDTCEVQNKALSLCTACGCVIPLKVKLTESSCPMELWLAYDDKQGKV